MKQINLNKINLHNIRWIIFKIVFGFGIIAGLLFIAISITQNKLFQLSETVSAIMEPNIKLIKLKEISGCIYGAEANVKAYTIMRDTTYLVNYENYITTLNTQIDTLLWLSTKDKIIYSAQVEYYHNFSLQIDTLSKLIRVRVNLLYEYIELKIGENSHDVLLLLRQKIKIKNPVVKNLPAGKAGNPEQKTETPKKSFFWELFQSKKNEEDMSGFALPSVPSDSVQRNILKIIAGAQHENRIKESKQLSEELNITQREYLVMNNIFSLLKRMEEKELVEAIKRVHTATIGTSAKIRFINKSLTVLGLIMALIFSYFIYLDILRARRFREQLLLAKTNAWKLASQYSLSLIEASLDPLITINTEGKITDMNEATVNIIGMSRENITSTDFFYYFTEPQKAREVYQEVFTKGYAVDFPLTLRHKDGKLTDVLFNGSVFKDDRGNILGVVVVARDITKQKRFENELIEAKSKAEQATQKAEESTKLMEAFLANMSHEIRTPVNAIMGFSDILSKKELGEQEKDYLNTIKSAGANLLTIINDILDISKIEAGMMTFEATNFSVKEIFKSLHILLIGKAKNKNLELLFNCEEDVPDVLLGDHTRLTQIIINLADNAIKFTQKGSVQVHAKVLENENGITLMEFSVTDTGIGIPRDKLIQIFERFRQAESHTTRKYGGTGLGLSITKHLVELQGGILSVKSELNVGSVFSFCIPYKKSLQTHVVSEEIENKYNLDDLSKLNILLVEDNQLNVKLISSLFSENNLKLQVAENGRECIEKLKENNGSVFPSTSSRRQLTTGFDIILMDMEMPVMNGYDAATIIRKELKNNIPIIAMTAHAMSGERERCLSLGMNDYISKPIDAILLFKKMYDLTHKF